MQAAIERAMSGVRSLPTVSKLLIASIVVILLMSLFLVSLYTRNQEMVPLGLKSGLDGQARSDTLRHLERRGVLFETRGAEIYVAPEEKYTLLAELTEGEVITASQIDFDVLLEHDSPFHSRAQNDRRWLVATMNVLSRTISKLDGIKTATVVIDEPGRNGGLGWSHVPPSASVNVIPSGDPLRQDQVDAIAALVAGAHAELTPEQVAVVDARAGRSYRTRPEGAIHAATHLELQQATEDRIREKLHSALAYIAGVNVAVHVVVDTREEVQRISTYDEPQIGVVSETTSSRVNATPSNDEMWSTSILEAGVNEEQSVAEMEARFPSTERNVRDAKGYALQINATIGVPRSYFARLQEDMGEPLDALVVTEMERIRRQIEPLLDTSAIEGAVSGTLSVSMIPDFAIAVAPVQGPSMSNTGAAPPLSRSDPMLRWIGLGGLALLSVLAIGLIVRRASPAEAPRQSAKQRVGKDDGASFDSVGAGDVARIIEQLNDSARTSPRETAFLLRKWMAVEQ
jgi:flagellar biosynthesis/type III secretory pathway M-ring protein FliF/YscJ